MSSGKEASGEQGQKVARGLLAFITSIALVVRDAGFLCGFNGAVNGAAIIYIFPPVMYLKLTARRIKEGTLQKTKRVLLERLLSRFLIFFGVGAAMAGGAVTVINSYFPQLILLW